MSTSIPNNLSLKLGIDSVPLSNGLDQAKMKLKGFEGSVQSAGRSVSQSFGVAQSREVRKAIEHLERLDKARQENHLAQQRRYNEIWAAAEKQGVQQRSLVVNTQKSTSQINKGFGGASTAVVNFNRVIQDSPYGLIGVANNIEPLVYSLTQLHKSAGSTGAAIKQFIKGAFTGPGALITLASVIPTAFIMYDKFFKDTGEAAKDAAKDLKEFTDEFTNIIDAQIKDMGIEGIEKQQTKVKATTQLWLEQSKTQKTLRQQIEGIDMAIANINNSTKGLNAEQNRVLLGLTDQKAEYQRQIELSKELETSLVTKIADAETKLLAMKMAQGSQAIRNLKTEGDITEAMIEQRIAAIELVEWRRKLNELAGMSTKSIGAEANLDNDTRTLKVAESTDAIIKRLAVSLNQVSVAGTQAFHDTMNPIVFEGMKLGAESMSNALANMQNQLALNLFQAKGLSKSFTAFGDTAVAAIKSVIAQLIIMTTLQGIGSLILSPLGVNTGWLTKAGLNPFGLLGGSRSGKQSLNANLYIDGQNVRTTYEIANRRYNRVAGN